MRRVAVALIVVVLALSAAPARAQEVTTDDLFALQDALYDASRDVATMSGRDAADLQRELDQLRDEIVYLRVKARKEGGVTRDEYRALRDRVDRVRMRAKGGSASSGATAPGASPDRPSSAWTDPRPENRPAEDVPVAPVRRPDGCGPYDVCVGQELDVRLQTALNSDTAVVEDRFEATTLVPFYNESYELIPAGSLLTGVVSAVDRAGRLDRKGSLSLAFERLTVRGRSYDVRATVSQAIESRGVRSEMAKITAGAGVGAMIGGVLGGVGGALAGLAIGGGGVLLATEGSDVKLPPGTVLRIRFDAPVTIR